MKPFDAVMFDLDGTLIETAPEIADAVNLTLRELSLNTVTQQQVNNWIGHGTLELLIKVSPAPGKRDAHSCVGMGARLKSLFLSTSSESKLMNCTCFLADKGAKILCCDFCSAGSISSKS